MNRVGAARLIVAGGFMLALAACERHAAAPDATQHAMPAASAAALAKPASTASAPNEQPVLAPITEYVLPGALAPDIGVEQLKQLFGARNVKIDERLPGEGGEPLRGVVLFADDSSRRAEVHFSDPGQLRGLYEVSVREADSRWRLDNGVHIGMSLAELVRRNGKPIRFSGFGWDYGGTITAWNGGKLDQRDGDPVVRGARLTQKPGLPDATLQTIPSDDGEYSSDDPKHPRLGELLQVGELTVLFAAEDDL